MENKVAVVGSRGFSEYSFFAEKLKYLIGNLKGGVEFVSGGCKSGADNLVSKFCGIEGYKLTEHLPDWDLHGKKAGFIRNQLIVNDATHLVAFWDGESKGTQSSIKMAEKKNIPIKIVKI